MAGYKVNGRNQLGPSRGEGFSLSRKIRRWCRCFEPEKDLAALQTLFMNDADLLTILGLSAATPIQKAEKIIKRSQWDNLVTNEKRLCLYFRPSRPGKTRIVTNELLQVDVHVPAKQDYLAYRAIARVEKMLCNQTINNRIYEFEGQLGELPTMTGFCCVGARFSFYAIK